MYDVIGDSGLQIVSSRILSYLDFESLEAACRVCKIWNNVIMQEKSLWLRHFEQLITRLELQETQKCVEDMKNYGPFRPFQNFLNWLEFFEKVKEKFATAEMKDTIQMFYDHGALRLLYLWKIDDAICKYGTLLLFRAYVRLQ